MGKISEQTLRECWDRHKGRNMHVIRVAGEEKKCGAEKIFGEIMAESLKFKEKH